MANGPECLIEYIAIILVLIAVSMLLSRNVQNEIST